MIGGQWLRQVQARLPDRLRTAAQRVVEAARETAPHKSGRLRDSLQVKLTEDGSSAQVLSTASYALAVELQQPFLRPALQQAHADVINEIREGLKP